ncbi:hypothetical protein JZ751_002073 [Albula glossodonta]|uniref:Uncharacterized protein n=1 Tax=Albula glossodonta TaxID=121402 RepID=A0A8T2PFS6_9TELE|nr:hypothetical protein JZ751_002073 [Albula glossodonta]
MCLMPLLPSYGNYGAPPSQGYQQSAQTVMGRQHRATLAMGSSHSKAMDSRAQILLEGMATNPHLMDSRDLMGSLKGVMVNKDRTEIKDHMDSLKGAMGGEMKMIMGRM